MIWISIFIANAAVLVLEIVGARALTPFFGSSAEVWAGIIGVVLLGLAAGYWGGGVVADRKNGVSHRELLMVVLSGAGLVTIAAWTSGDAISALTAALIQPLGLTLSAALAALFLLFVPSVLLAAASPIAIKILLRSLDETARTSGRLSAVSAAGSVIGSLGVGVVLIPYVGSTTALIGMGVVLIAVAAFLAERTRELVIPCLTAAAALIAWLAGVLLSPTFSDLALGRIVEVKDTRYSRIVVVDTQQAPETYLRSIRTDPWGVQCGAYFINDAMQAALPYEYTRAFDISLRIVPEITTALVIGGCNYSYPGHLSSRLPMARVDVVEIDPGMTQVAEKWFGFSETPSLRPIHEDGRRFLNATVRGSYDVVIVDAFSSPLSTPFQLLTEEAFEAMRDALKPGGAVVFNIIASPEGPGGAYIASVRETLLVVFPEVRIFRINARPSQDIQNLIVVAAPEHLAIEEPHVQVNDLVLEEIPPEIFSSSKALVLRDDFAPVERLTKPMLEYVLYP